MRRWAFAITGALVLAIMIVAAWVLVRPHGPSPSPRPRARATVAARGIDRSEHAGPRSRADEPRAPARVAGLVLDAEGEPLPAGGAVVLSCPEPVPIEGGGVVRLAEDGSFEGPAPPCAEICVGLVHPAYVAAEPWLVQPGPPATLIARPLPRLHGLVQDPRGQPLAAARVSFLSPEDEEAGLLPLATRSTTTDEDGRFSVAWIEHPPCGPCEEARPHCSGGGPTFHDHVRVVANTSGYTPSERVLEARPLSDPDAPLVIVLAPAAGTLTGRLVGPNGEPYPRAFVLARSLTRAVEVHRAEASEGVFTFTGLGDGPYVVQALQDGLELASRSPLHAGQTIALTGSHAVAARKLVVELRDEKDVPLEGVRVDGGPFVDAATDGRGRVEALDVLAGDYTVVTRGPGLTPIDWSVHVMAPPPGQTADEEIVHTLGLRRPPT